MIVYAVFKRGIYRHECAGVFISAEEAMAWARELALVEDDGYHNLEVVSFELNKRADVAPGLDIHEAPPIYVAKGQHKRHQ